MKIYVLAAHYGNKAYLLFRRNHISMFLYNLLNGVAPNPIETRIDEKPDMNFEKKMNNM